MKSLFGKMILSFLLVIIFFTGFLLYFSFKSVQRNFIETKIEDLKSISYLIADKSVLYLDERQEEELRKYISENGIITNITIEIFNSSGELIADSENNLKGSNKQSNQNEIKSFIEKYKSGTYLAENISRDEIFVYNTKSTKDNNLIIVKVSVPLKDDFNFMDFIKYDLILYSFFIIFISSILIAMFTLKVLKPIRELSRASRKVALGDFENKLFIPGENEISQLVGNFNQMTDKLKAFFDLAQSRQERYLMLISSMQTGLIVLDKDGKIKLHNKSFENICKTNLVQGRSYKELISHVKFYELIKSVGKKKKPKSCEIEFQNQILLCSANYIESKNELIVLFHDITEIKKLENVKRDFVVNVTHELRTPLTAIKGFIDTIEEEIKEEDVIFPYIKILKRHTDRIINIVQDLLILSEIEQSTSHLQLSSIDINMIFDGMPRVFEQKLADKGLQLIREVNMSNPLILIDPFRIEQVLINLIDNAIKYTDKGFVKITAHRDSRNAILTVEDTGAGIPAEHHNRLFERFYTVDKSRSRKVGGTGLGLSIVKHIVLLHNGDIKVESSTGRGTKFIISIPQPQVSNLESAI